MKFKTNTERTLALSSAQELVGSALKAGRNLTADESAEVEGILAAAEDFTRGSKGRALLDAIGKSGTAPECKRRPKEGQTVCDCRQVDVAKLDAAVWAEVVGVLGDRERLLKLAAEWTRNGATSEADTQEVERLGEQARKLTRAIQRATDEAFMADEPEELLLRVARYRSQLADVKAKLDALQTAGPGALGNARQLTELVALADRAAERLQHFGDAERLELAELLALRVEVSGPLVGGLPESVTVRGVLDPRAQ